MSPTEQIKTKTCVCFYLALNQNNLRRIEIVSENYAIFMHLPVGFILDVALQMVIDNVASVIFLDTLRFLRKHLTFTHLFSVSFSSG